jgi:hypothetical protein
MAKKKNYPIVGSWQQTTVEVRSGCTRCDECDRQFEKREKFWLREIQTSYFRGDDEVEHICDACKKKRDARVIGTMTVNGEVLTVLRREYPNGRLAIELADAQGIPYSILSVNIVTELAPGPGQFFAKTWSENEPLREPALASGLFEDTGARVKTGFVQAEVWRLKSA